MNPKPLVALKNLTVPIAMIWSLSVKLRPSSCLGGAIGRDHQLGKSAVSSSAHKVRSGADSALLLTRRRRPRNIGLSGGNYNPAAGQPRRRFVRRLQESAKKAHLPPPKSPVHRRPA